MNPTTSSQRYNKRMDKIFSEAKQLNDKYRPLHLSKLIFTHNDLHSAWLNKTKIKVLEDWYRVGKMSYGQYFLEPEVSSNEQYGFNAGTIWLTETITGNNYVIEQGLV